MRPRTRWLGFGAAGMVATGLACFEATRARSRGATEPEAGRTRPADELVPEPVGSPARRFLPEADHRTRQETLVRAPADVVFDVAWSFDMRSPPLVRRIFRLREKLLRAEAPRRGRRTGLVEETLGLGWGMLAHRPGRELVMGAVTKPWEANVRFAPVAPEKFATFAEPGLVKIVWTLEAEPLAPALTRFRTETRAAGTDEAARRKFRRYWRRAGPGIVLIRLLLLPRIRRQAERRYRGRRC